ncbi:MAG: major facilitator superfamily 1 [Rhodospirillales bacterium]|nr:major facilitator superfamily 1 [Rhodospirillales bacterium]
MALSGPESTVLSPSLGTGIASATGIVSATGLRARIGLLVILSCISFNILLVLALQPVLSTIAAYFDGGTHGALIAQLLETMSGIGIMVGGPIAGWIAERRIGRRNLLLAALALYGLSGSACMFLDNASALLTLRLLQGLGSAGIAVSTYSLVSERFQGAARSRVIGYQGAFVSGMGIVSLPVAGLIADSYGWHAPFALYLSALVMLAVAIVTVPNSPAVSQQAAKQEDGGSLIAMWPLYALIVPIYLLANMVNLHISFVLAGDGIHRPSLQSYIMLASSILYMVGGLFYGRMVVRLGARRMLAAILALMAASGLAVGLSHGIVMTAIGVGLSGFSGGFLIPLITNLVLNMAPAGARSRALGFMYTAMYIGNFLNPLIMTPAREAIGNHQVFLTVGLLLAVAAAAQALVKRSIISD